MYQPKQIHQKVQYQVLAQKKSIQYPTRCIAVFQFSYAYATMPFVQNTINTHNYAFSPNFWLGFAIAQLSFEVPESHLQSLLPSPSPEHILRSSLVPLVLQT